LHNLKGNAVALTWGRPDQVSSAADLTIWDIDDVAELSDLPQDGFGYQNIFIASREQIEWLREFQPNNVAATLLKPLAEGPLRVCLDQVLNWEKRIDPDSNGEGDSNTLLQFTLEAIVRLQEYDQDRTNFIARAVHDFRAPLTALKGYCGLLLDQQLGPIPPPEVEVLLRMRHSVERLSRMAEDMFQLTAGNRCNLKLNLQDIDLSICIDQAVHELRPFMDEKEIHLTVDADISPAPARVDSAQIEQVLINILDNACKFTPRYGSIGIRGYPFFWERRWTTTPRLGAIERRQVNLCAHNAYRIDIGDSGPAIPLVQLSTIFEEYTSCGGGHDRSGAGLGLAICKLIISRHNGRVWAESNGNGNVFSVVLPLDRSEAHSLKQAC
jgi:signal transduction histidine kinase